MQIALELYYRQILFQSIPMRLSWARLDSFLLWKSAFCLSNRFYVKTAQSIRCVCVCFLLLSSMQISSSLSLSVSLSLFRLEYTHKTQIQFTSHVTALNMLSTYTRLHKHTFAHTNNEENWIELFVIFHCYCCFSRFGRSNFPLSSFSFTIHAVVNNIIVFDRRLFSPPLTIPLLHFFDYSIFLLTVPWFGFLHIPHRVIIITDAEHWVHRMRLWMWNMFFSIQKICMH